VLLELTVASSSSSLKEIGWEPKVSLEQGLEKTYNWIETKVNEDRESLTEFPEIEHPAKLA